MIKMCEVTLGFPHRALAQRVLAHLENPDPVPVLLEMIGKEDNEARKSDLISDLAKTRSKRAYEPLLDLIRTSPSTTVRSMALHGLGTLGSDESLRALVEFSREPFPGWKAFKNITPQMAIMWALQKATKQDFGSDFAAWEKWLREHPGFPALAD